MNLLDKLNGPISKELSRLLKEELDAVSSCDDCGQTIVPGEHTGHHGHFTGAWICHDCGPLCDGNED